MLLNVEFGKWYWKRGTATYKQTVHLKEHRTYVAIPTCTFGYRN